MFSHGGQNAFSGSVKSYAVSELIVLEVCIRQSDYEVQTCSVRMKLVSLAIEATRRSHRVLKEYLRRFEFERSEFLLQFGESDGEQALLQSVLEMPISWFTL